ncbi:MAG: hypothetical protein RL095_97 [Verrucomicrobiota bacterium]|jgi:radical SAM superfamily enzyme YgiQ (UPF0313 family)
MRILLILPPLTQLNTPYPSTAYLSGFLRRAGHEVRQLDLGLELVLELFSSARLPQLFSQARRIAKPSPGLRLILEQEEAYVGSVDAVIAFLQGRDPTLSHRINSRSFLPEGGRFAALEQLPVGVFGSLDSTEKARHLATLYLEDLSDLIQEGVSRRFAFGRYAESLAVSANRFDELDRALRQSPDFLDQIMLDILRRQLEGFSPELSGLSAPFPGNIYAALRCGAEIKRLLPTSCVSLGGGYPNTELRQISDPRVFDFVDAITLDDGELPLSRLIAHLSGGIPREGLCRTFMRSPQKKVVWHDGAGLPDISHQESGWPDYAGLPMDRYLSVIEMANPMHRLWSDGRWNKLTVAHGCYWKRCTFCDTGLDYISRYDEAPASLLAERMEAVMKQTGQSGFHFVDEAAPPAVLRELALEILRRGLRVSWWGNIRFEKAFTPSLCRLLAASGCIAVSGGLEVASDRVLGLIRKGTSLRQATQALQAFRDSGILVHGYLMYGFPTQTSQETLDSLEVVRQLFEAELLKSGFFHRFALTEHSPVAKNPDRFGVEITGPAFGGFARNELQFSDRLGDDPSPFTSGLNAALYNYMHANCLDQPVSDWFDFDCGTVSLPPDLIAGYEEQARREDRRIAARERLLWLSPPPRQEPCRKKGFARITFGSGAHRVGFEVPAPLAEWLGELLPQLTPGNYVSFAETEDYFKQYFDDGDWQPFLESPVWEGLLQAGLLHLSPDDSAKNVRAGC